MAVLGQPVRAEAGHRMFRTFTLPDGRIFVLHDRRLVEIRYRRLKPGYQVGGQPIADLRQPTADLQSPTSGNQPPTSNLRQLTSASA